MLDHILTAQPQISRHVQSRSSESICAAHCAVPPHPQIGKSSQVSSCITKYVTWLSILSLSSLIPVVRIRANMISFELGRYPKADTSSMRSMKCRTVSITCSWLRHSHNCCITSLRHTVLMASATSGVISLGSAVLSGIARWCTYLTLLLLLLWVDNRCK